MSQGLKDGLGGRDLGVSIHSHWQPLVNWTITHILIRVRNFNYIKYGNVLDEPTHHIAFIPNGLFIKHISFIDLCLKFQDIEQISLRLTNSISFSSL